MRPVPDVVRALRLYLVAGPDDCPGWPLAEVVTAAARGGAGMVQLRHKGVPTADLAAEARALMAMLEPLGVPLLVNDDPYAALEAGAHGVHLGQQDMDPREARRILGPDAVIGWTVKTPEQAREAASMGVDYVGVGPVYASTTKPDAGRVLALEGVVRMRGATDLPMVAIGGIMPGRAGVAVRAGADGVAVVSAVCAADNPEAATRTLLAEIDAALGGSAA